MECAVLGGGSWGTALAILWAREGHKVHLWVRDSEQAAIFRKHGRNTKYLADFAFPEQLHISDQLEETVRENHLLILVTPLRSYRAVLTRIAPLLDAEHRIILCSKGIETESLMLPPEIVYDVLGASWHDRVFALSGPSFAKEVAAGKPTAIVLAGPEVADLKTLQKELTTPTFRLYRNTDMIGVELGGALKNVIAIAAGMATGLELGHNSLAGLMTRGLHEIATLGKAMGAHRRTFSGLAGMGDLILTCTGNLSRNLRVGMGVARGGSLDTVLNDLGMVAEGVYTCRATRRLSEKYGLDLPISEVVFRILFEGLTPQNALMALMTRRLKPEQGSLNSDQK